MVRIDLYLVDRKMAVSRERAKGLIKAGLVQVNGKVVTKAAYRVLPDDRVEVTGPSPIRYVGRGGLKLERAISCFGLDFTGCNVLDIGASTGGFTHCALEHGAAHVWAVDVGSNQLDAMLRNDSRVRFVEQTDIRNLNSDFMDGKANYIVVDVSFISLSRIVHVFRHFLKPDGSVITLIKPQFEAGRAFVGKNGVVRDRKVHIEVIRTLMQTFSDHGFFLNRLTYAPIPAKGHNIEYLALWSTERLLLPDIGQTVESAFELYASG